MFTKLINAKIEDVATTRTTRALHALGIYNQATLQSLDITSLTYNVLLLLPNYATRTVIREIMELYNQRVRLADVVLYGLQTLHPTVLKYCNVTANDKKGLQVLCNYWQYRQQYGLPKIILPK